MIRCLERLSIMCHVRTTSTDKCYFALQPPGVAQELIDVPELQREHVACLHHLAALLVRNKDKGRSESNKSAEEQAQRFLSRAENIESTLANRRRLPYSLSK